MRKRVITLFFLLSLMGSSFLLAASPVDMKIYPVSNDIYKAIKTLYIITGKSLPSTSAPYSNDELMLMVEQIDKDILPIDAIPTYNYVYQALHTRIAPFSIHAKLALEAYIHPNTDHFNENEDWNFNYAKRAPLLSIPIEISLQRFFYARMELDLANAKYSEPDPPTDGASPLYGKYAFTTNFLQFWRPEEIIVDGNVPNIGFAAIGGRGWTFEVGKDKVSWGPGQTGNFLVSDNLQYHNMGRFTAYSKNFKYTFLTSFFPHPDEIYNVDQDETIDTEPGEPHYSQARNMVGLKMFMAYRLEGRLFNDTLGIALTEGIMYQSDDGTINLRALNPFTIYHNYYIVAMANSLISLELNYTPLPSLNIYGQIALDEYNLPAERSNNPDLHPNAVAYMLGGTYSHPLQGGILNLNIEGVYTDPYLYLRSRSGTEEQSTDPFDTLNYVVAIRRWTDLKVIYDQAYLGYQYGGDAIVGNISLGYTKIGKWSVQGNAFYMVHGDKSTTSEWLLGTNESTPSESATHYVDIGVSGKTHLFDSLEVYGGINYLAQITHLSHYHDVQLHMGARYSL